MTNTLNSISRPRWEKIEYIQIGDHKKQKNYVAQKHDFNLNIGIISFIAITHTVISTNSVGDNFTLKSRFVRVI